MYEDRVRYPMPDLILTDLRMGPVSGIDLVEWVRCQMSPLKDTTIIMLTGSARPGDVDAARQAGVQNVCRKPTKLEELRELLANIADQFCPERAE